MKLTPKQIIGIIYATILLSVILSSCYTEKKAEKQVTKALIKKPLVVAKIARDAFPCTTIKQDTLIVTYDTTLLIGCPELPYQEYIDTTDRIRIVEGEERDHPARFMIKTVRVPVKLPIQTRYITKTVEDSAKIKIAVWQVQESKKLIDELTGKVARKNKMIMWLFILLGGVAIGLVLKLKFF